MGFKEAQVEKQSVILEYSFLGMMIYLEEEKWLFWSLMLHKDPGTYHQS